MQVYPSLDEVRAIASKGEYDIVPLSMAIFSDFTTPIEALKSLRTKSSHCFLLESVAEKEKWGRYTFLGFEPTLEVTCSEGMMQIGKDKPFLVDNPDSKLRDILANHKSPRFDYLPSFTGGLVGYFSYDYLGYSEPSVRVKVEDHEHFKDLDLMLFDKVICFDNFKQKIILIANAKLSADDKELEASYQAAVAELKRMARLLHGVDNCPSCGKASKGSSSCGDFSKSSTGKTSKCSSALPTSGKILSKIEPLFSEEQYCAMVKKAQHYIHEGDIFQIVLSNRLSADFEGSLLDTYRVLRTVNPSPYMFYFGGTDVEVAGASPETLVKLENGVLHTFPLAGTRPRGKTEEEDLALEQSLLHDEKELAEHNMLVDLGRNDLGKISKFGTVKVEKFHSIERYSHVMHIGSTVRGEIRDDCDALDAIAAVLPAGTLSGAPKIRACQIIAELENNKRGIYGGGVGYIDFTGNMDLCIAIRIAYKKNNKVFVRSGAGIVADSNPHSEYQECINKAKAVVAALEQASDMASFMAELEDGDECDSKAEPKTSNDGSKANESDLSKHKSKAGAFEVTRELAREEH